MPNVEACFLTTPPLADEADGAGGAGGAEGAEGADMGDETEVKMGEKMGAPYHRRGSRLVARSTVFKGVLSQSN